MMNWRYLKPMDKILHLCFHVRITLHHLGTLLPHEDELTRIKILTLKVHATVFAKIMVLMHVKYG